jgi:hypothetical protein
MMYDDIDFLFPGEANFMYESIFFAYYYPLLKTGRGYRNNLSPSIQPSAIRHFLSGAYLKKY